MNWKMFSVGLFAILASYLIIFLPVAAADTTVRVFLGESYADSATIPDMVSRVLAVSSGTLSIDITNSTSDGISTVYVYNCVDKTDPDQCVGSVTPDIYTAEDSALHVEYSWDEVKDSTEKSRFVFVVKVHRPGGSTWLTFWDRMEKIGSSYIPYYGEAPGTVDLFATGSVGSVIQFIQQRAMLPFNTAWKITRAVFTGAGKLYELKSGAGVPPFTASTKTGDEITTPMSQSYSYIFPESAGEIFNGITLVSPATYTLGNGNCESGDGESSTVPGGCFDCPCPSSQYCNGPGTTEYESYSCRSLSSIGISVVGSSGYKVSGCGQHHQIWIIAEIANSPDADGLLLESQSYSMGGGSQTGIASCTPNVNDRHNCTITFTIPDTQECRDGDYRLSGNSIEFGISFVNGSGRLSKTLSASFSDIAVGSWECGDGACEDWLGEDRYYCCRDCPCATGQYCDWDGTSASTGECKTALVDGNLQVRSLGKLNFNPYQGEQIKLEATISPKPTGLAVSGPACTTSCMEDGEECSAACSVSCSENPGDIYNATCQMKLTVSGYDSNKDYVLLPEMGFQVSYRNGSNYVSQELSHKGIVVTFGASVCGDGTPGGDETSTNCCYDVECGEEEFCDWTEDMPKSGDYCKLLSGIAIEGVWLENTDFNKSVTADATMKETTINLSAVISNLPDSFEKLRAVSCAFGESGEACTINCQDIEEGRINCTLTIPEIAYSDWIGEIGGVNYNPDTQVLTLDSNVLNFTIRFNDGGRGKVEHMISADLPDITLHPMAECGNGWCDDDFGEDATNCCWDCACSNSEYFTTPDRSNNSEWICIPGDNVNSTCEKLKDIMLVANVPKEFGCDILPEALGGNCTSVEVFRVNATILKMPSNLDLVAGGQFYTHNGQEVRMDCLPEPTDQKQNYTCDILLPEIANSEEGTEVHSMSISFGVKYWLDDGKTLVTKNLTSKTASFTVNRTWSDDRMNCTNLENKVNKQIRKVEKKIDKSRIWGYSMMGVSLVLFILSYWCGNWCAYAGCVALGIGTYLLMYAIGLGTVKDALESIKNTQVEMCTGGDVRSINSDIDSASSDKDAITGALTISLGIVGLCLAIVGAIGGGGEAATKTVETSTTKILGVTVSETTTTTITTPVVIP